MSDEYCEVIMQQQCLSVKIQVNTPEQDVPEVDVPFGVVRLLPQLVQAASEPPEDQEPMGQREHDPKANPYAGAQTEDLRGCVESRCELLGLLVAAAGWHSAIHLSSL